MIPLFGLGIAREEQFSLLPSEIPEEFSFLEIPGGLLDQTAVVSRLKQLSVKQQKALVIRDLMPPYLVDGAITSALRLKIEFDNEFRRRCQLASSLGCRVVSMNFHIERALNEADFNERLVRMLLSMAGTLEEMKLLLALPCRVPNVLGAAAPSAFLAFKHRLFYPGFRYRTDFHFEDPHAFEQLAAGQDFLKFERNFWRISYLPQMDSELDAAVLESLRPYWNPQGRRPVFVCIDPGVAVPDELMIRQVSSLIRDFTKKDSGDGKN